MKHFTKKFLATVCALTALANLAACGGGSGGETEEVDNTKAQLYLDNFDGGVGTEWLERSVARFEEKYKDYEFVPGKKGVQVWIERSKGVDLTQFRQHRTDIYFMESANYYNAVSVGALLDITDMVTEKMTEFGEEKSVEDKILPEYKNYYKTSAGKYYAVPHYQGIYGITYDRALWNEKGLFLGANGQVGKKETDTGLSNGPDGKSGTYDDGLPATYDEFFKVCAAMVQRSIDPITWSGQYQWYATGYLGALKADFEGEFASLPYSYDGRTYDKLVKSINPDGTVVYDEPLAITEENGYEMYRSAGNYYTAQFMEKIVDNNYYASQSFNSSVSHVDVQGTYLLSKYAGKRIGMLIEGCWWANEAASYVSTMENRYGDTFDSRRFALLPYPKATAAEVGEPQTVLDTANSIAGINGNIAAEKVELAKTFLQFLHTEAELVDFVVTTGVTRAFDYTIPQDVYNNLNTFAKSVVDVVKNGNGVMPASSNDFYYNHASAFECNAWLKTDKWGYATTALKNGVSAADLFEQIKSENNSVVWGAMLN